MTLNMLPKVELHLHLEGAAPPSFIKGLAKEKNIDIGRIFNDDGSYRFADFWEFIKIYEAACTTLQKPEDFYRLTMAVLEQSAASGVVYSETFLSPDFCGGRDLGAWREYLHAIEEAAAQAETSFGITLRGIITCIRHFGPEKARETVRCAAETHGKFIVGFGIAGDEKIGAPKDFAWSFDAAREAGLRLTAHAGEWGGPDSVRAAIQDLGVERIQVGLHQVVSHRTGRGDILNCQTDRTGFRFSDPDREHFRLILVSEDDDIRIVVGVEHEPFDLHLRNHLRTDILSLALFMHEWQNITP